MNKHKAPGVHINFTCFTLDPACRTQGNGNYVTDNSCRSYYSCNSGFRINVGTCNSGTYFNVISGNCQTQIPPGQGCVGKSGFWRLLYLKLTVYKLSYCKGASRVRAGQGIWILRQGILGHFRPLWGIFGANSLFKDTFPFEGRGCIPLLPPSRCAPALFNIKLPPCF